ncbi:MAG: hypothetical protein H7336_05085 [Bacteriovorax sp.]|nr:hypothetical protein [Bacteriovorax sp.]
MAHCQIKSLKFRRIPADTFITMAAQNLLIMNLLRIITPEEIADIATKHNGGKFLSLTDLVNERVERKIYRDFSSTDSVDEIHEEHIQISGKEGAKILPFGKKEALSENVSEDGESLAPRFVVQAKHTSQIAPQVIDQVAPEKTPVIEHRPDENMSSFILIEKARLKSSQKTLKQKEIIDLYQKNSNVDVELIKSTNQSPSSSSEGGVLINKKHF